MKIFFLKKKTMSSKALYGHSDLRTNCLGLLGRVRYTADQKHSGKILQQDSGRDLLPEIFIFFIRREKVAVNLYSSSARKLN